MVRRSERGAGRPAAASLAALVACVALCAADALAGGYPFGPRTRSVNDLGNQYVPLHAHLWDLLHGRADGGLLVNWQSGYGSSFLPDFGTYLASPFAPLVAFFPRDEIDLAVYVITVLKIACAAAVMACLLLALRPGRWWAAGPLGASYALCGWTLADADYNPMWLDGLIALPLLCLVGEWALAGRRRVLGVLLVALVWSANFYTAYMATLGAALVLLVRLSLAGPTRRQALAAAGRAVLTVVLGTGLAAPLVAVVYLGTKHAYPGRVRPFSPVPTEDLVARLLPGTYGWGSPALYVGTTALLLALALPFHRAVPGRVRAAWTALVLAVALSLQWAPTSLAWHAFATPQGSSYRQTFVLAGLLVIAAWHALSYGPPRPAALGAATALLALGAVAARRSDVIHAHTWPLLLLAAGGTLTGLLLLRGAGRHGGLAALAVLVLLGAQLGESAATSAVASGLRLKHLDDYAPFGQRQQRQAAAIAGADDWPRRRTEPGREQTVANDPMLVGGQGAAYYSSLTSDVLSRTLTALGGGWTSRGRGVQSLDNAVTDVLFSVGARVHSPPDPHQTHRSRDTAPPTVTRRDVPPLVTVRPGPGTTPFGASPYRNQELLLGSRVYTVPALTVHDDAGAPLPARRVGSGTARTRPAITASCPPGTQVNLWAPHFSGTARLATGTDTAVFRSVSGRSLAAMEPLGRTPASGRVRIELVPDRPGRIPPGAVGCLDTARLDTAAARLTATGATAVTVSDGTLHAQLPPGSRGLAVVAAPRIAGWRCAAGDGPARPADQYHGLIAVPLDGSRTSLTCTFHPPGLRLGTTVGLASLTVLLLLTAGTAVRRRRTSAPAPTAPPAPRERATAAH
ncbi:YfhO family protein [Streptomyces sp. NEAU-sy36]|uniref:YfhO family protein n=1 Tax=unclassified Streptomyces TaxID=2593676 RepID=UPI0015D6571C|nr:MULTISPECIES: YfhO family protein [unclassified Streptomyces]QLJ01327.1 YfhO family protein [Streptomyces sp. NEAU-sy36]